MKESSSSLGVPAVEGGGRREKEGGEQRWWTVVEGDGRQWKAMEGDGKREKLAWRTERLDDEAQLVQRVLSRKDRARAEQLREDAAHRPEVHLRCRGDCMQGGVRHTGDCMRGGVRYTGDRG